MTGDQRDEPVSMIGGTLHTGRSAPWEAGPVTEPGTDLEAPPPRVDLRLRIWLFTFDAHRVIYATIILMTSYAVYNEGAVEIGPAAFVSIAAVSIAPLFALSMAHAFSDALDLQIRNGRRLTGRDRRHLAATNLQYLYVAIPPLLLILALGFVGWEANDIIVLVQSLGVGSLFLWGLYAGRKAGVGRWRQVSFGISYGLMGIFIITVELVLTH
jgi:hypothetical protein